MFAQNIDFIHVNGLPYFKGITYLPLLFSFCFVFVERPSKQFYSHVGTEQPLPRYYRR